MADQSRIGTICVYVVGVICLMWVLPFIGFLSTFFDGAFGYHTLKSTGAFDRVGEDIAVEQHGEVMDFLLGDEKISFLSGNEFLHMIDVRNVMRNSFGWFLFGLAVFASTVTYFRQNYYRAAGHMLFAAVGLLLIGGLIAVLELVSFNTIFVHFHYLFFPQGNWIFPYESPLIQLYAQDFFFLMTQEIAIRTSIIMLLSIISGVLLLGWQKSLQQARRQSSFDNES